MSDMKIIDKDGVWVINQGEHRMPDYLRQNENPGTDLVILEPGVPTKIKFTESLRANVNLVEIEDPTQTDEITPKVRKSTKADTKVDTKADDKSAA